MAETGFKYTKPFSSEEDGGSVHSYSGPNFASNKRTTCEKVLAGVVLILAVLFIVFLALFIHQKEKYDDCKDSVGSKGNATEAPTAIPTTAAPDYGRGPWENVRLPKYFQPVHYDVRLVVDLKKLVFSGNVSVNVSLTSVTKYMFLHVNKLNISSPKLIKSGASTLSLARHFWYKKNQFYVLESDEEMEKGYYVIEMNFIGKLDNDLKGLYKSTYKNKMGEEIVRSSYHTVRTSRFLAKTDFEVKAVFKPRRVFKNTPPSTIASTQMQPTDARKTFPCFDEPSFKAKFTVTLVRHKDMISITNMPLERSVSEGNEMVADHYQTTVIMSTYLLAFVVCDFGYLQTYAGENNSSMRFYATKDQIDQAEFARSISGEILEHFEKYFRIPYPLPKADMIAIPDFAAGAMENWGLITYRETAMLYKKGQSSEGNKERIVVVIAHELAHMWFGNLVTPEWWDDLWLNEGFASFVEYIGVEKAFPKWKMEDMFVTLDMKRAFSLDALVTSHPILVPVNHPDEINEIFDSISYNKGASVIRMLQHFLGQRLFTRGLTNYLRHFKYGSAKTKDLWDFLTQASKKAGVNIDVAEIMDTWTLQMGFPVVNVSAEGNNIVVTQQRFLSDIKANLSNTKYTSNFGYKWNIPFTVEVRPHNTSVEVDTTGLELTWMKIDKEKTTVKNKIWNKANQWVKGNIGQTGFYRVNYPVENWKLLADQLQHNHSVLSISDRAGLILDAFALADAKQLKFKYALDLTKYLDKEQDYIPWSAAYDSFGSITEILPQSRKVNQGLKKYRFQKMSANQMRLGFNDTGGHLDKYLRTLAIYSACSVKDKACLKFTKDSFDAWIRNDTLSPVPADLRSPVYFYGMSQSGEEEWDIAFQRLQKTNVASERRKLMFGLAGAPEPWLLNRYLQYAFDEKKIKSQDTSFVISYVANSNPIGRHFAWNFLKEKWSAIIEKYGAGFGFAMNRFVNGVASSFSTEWELEELEDLFKKHPETGSGTQARKQLLERVRSNIEWRNENEKDIEDWLGSLNII